MYLEVGGVSRKNGKQVHNEGPYNFGIVPRVIRAIKCRRIR